MFWKQLVGAVLLVLAFEYYRFKNRFKKGGGVGDFLSWFRESLFSGETSAPKKKKAAE